MNQLPALGCQLFISEYIQRQLFVRLYYGLPSLIGTVLYNIFLWFTGVGGLISLLSGSSFSKDGNGNQ